MKKLLLSAALIVVNFAFGQITLDHDFTNEYAFTYVTDTQTFYISRTPDNKIKIYNSDFSLYKTVNVPMPTNYDRLLFWGDTSSLVASRNVFNTDSKFEFLVGIYSTVTNAGIKLILINEDGTLIKDFHPNTSVSVYAEEFEIYHDSVQNLNKLIVHSQNPMANGNSLDSQTQIYSLPTSTLTSKEIQNNTKLSAFPIPTNKILNITNPGNGANKVQIYDATGKLVVDKSFFASDNKISIDVESLPKGVYIYKIGNLSSKFTKN